MKQNKLDPNNFFSKQNISLEEATALSKPIPPWRRKLLMDLLGNKNSSAVYVPGVNEEPEKEDDMAPIIKKKNPRRWLSPILILLTLIHWAIVLVHNLIDVVSDGIHEIILALENFISNAQTEPDRVPPSN